MGPGRANIIEMAKTRRLIILRPNQYNQGDLRLALFREDYQSYVQGRDIQSLYINFGSTERRIYSLASYRNHGSIVKKSIVSTWLHAAGYKEESQLLLFELIHDDVSRSHTYRFLGSVAYFTNLINTAQNKIR